MMSGAVSGFFDAAFVELKACIREEIRSALREAHNQNEPADLSLDSEFLTPEECAALQKVTLPTMRQWINGWAKEGRIRKYGKGRRYRIRKSELIAALAEDGAKAADDDGDDLASIAILSRKRR